MEKVKKTQDESIVLSALKVGAFAGMYSISILRAYPFRIQGIIRFFNFGYVCIAFRRSTLKELMSILSSNQNSVSCCHPSIVVHLACESKQQDANPTPFHIT